MLFANDEILPGEFLGVQKKLLEVWISGLNREMKAELDQLIRELRVGVPSNFQRKPRTIEELKNYKEQELEFEVCPFFFYNAYL